MLYKFFTNSKRAWQAMFADMSRAEKSIFLEMYIFVDDMSEFNFLKLLKEKAESGVKVKIIIDSFGSSDLSKEGILSLKNAGAEIIFFSHIFYRTHRKVLIVDEKVAFIGGVNFEEKMNKWMDLVVRVEGSLVKSITRSFSKAYANYGGKDQALIALNKEIVFSKAKTWVMEHFPISNKYHLKKLYKEALRDSETSVLLVSPYFTPKRWLMGAIHQAVLRGVKVEVLIPKTTDHFLVDRVNHFYIYKMSKLGVKFFLEPKMNHAKALIVDEKEGMIGSNNLDFFSFELNSEIGVFIKDTQVIHKLLKITNEWKEESVLFDPNSYNPKWIDRILSPLIRLLFFL
ncbi:MAG: phosphatidylserine/phosphatidylglycerophosphate/cardiolipin synthase family protein [Candidatus Pacebacteria bacterium]|nr:phosphatidylserine/phosphatidylglycerophosphate/cardiolipin synthase family protein [Candidatus Paceibacterota bacterium]